MSNQQTGEQTPQQIIASIFYGPNSRNPVQIAFAKTAGGMVVEELKKNGWIIVRADEFIR